MQLSQPYVSGAENMTFNSLAKQLRESFILNPSCQLYHFPYSFSQIHSPQHAIFWLNLLFIA